MEKINQPFYVFDSHMQADDAIKTLHRSGFDVKKLSLIGKGYHSDEHPVGFYSTGDKIKTWGGVGAFWGGIWGLLLATAVFFYPRCGPDRLGRAPGGCTGWRTGGRGPGWGRIGIGGGIVTTRRE
jgi:hypothetical protein